MTKTRGLTVSGEHTADLGPITMPSQIPVIERHIREGIDTGGRALLGGTESVRPPFVDPVVLSDVPEDCSAVTEETFGPVIVINRVASIDEAIDKANNTRFGLGATVFSRKRGADIARRLRVGMVGINSVVPFFAMPALPFGGVGESGFGRIHGEDGLQEFTRPLSTAHKRFPALLTPTSFEKAPYTISVLKRLTKILYGR